MMPEMGGLPVRLKVWGLPGALSLMLTLAVRTPFAVGVKVTLIWQLALLAKVVPQLLFWAKSPALAPVMATPEIVSVCEP